MSRDFWNVFGVEDRGCKNVVLCEDCQITRDEKVLPAFWACTTFPAKRQSMCGTFCHGISHLTPDGKLHGSVPPYGLVNAAGLIGNMAFVTGKCCGVTDEEVDTAMDRGSKFFGYFEDKGEVPYREHMASASHGNNAMAAVMHGISTIHPEDDPILCEGGQGFVSESGIRAHRPGNQLSVEPTCKVDP